MENNLKIAVVSDLHCRYSEGKKITEVHSYLTSDLTKSPIDRNPIESLKKVIVASELKADILICPGDVSDKSDKQGLISGWKYLEELKISFQANNLVGTVGNHDVNSRGTIKDNGPFDLLKTFTDNFPTSNDHLNTLYWANDYCILSDTKYDLLIFNSSNNHIDDKLCYESKITPHTLNRIKSELEKLDNNEKIKIAMCHHHPIKHSNMDYKDGDSIEKGDDLLKLLTDFNFSLIVHGHKHDPQLNYHNKLPVFAAGSFSSMMNLLDLGAENTFHFIELSNNKTGIIRSWIYGPKEGWTQKADTYFPCFTGFGVNVNLDDLASKCSDWFLELNSNHIEYRVLVNKFPEIDFLIPSEQKAFDAILKNKHRIQFLPELLNRPQKLFKMY